MPNPLGENLNLCFKKIKFPLTSQPSSSPLTPDDKSRPFASSAATASSPLFKSYNSLYDDTFDSSNSKSLIHSSALCLEPEPREPESYSEPDFATIFASQRFFFTSPGSSNSIIESTTSSIATTPESSDTLLAPGSSNSVIESTTSSIATTPESSDTLLTPGSSNSVIESTTSSIATTPESSDTLLTPGSSNSIIESTTSSIATTPELSNTLLAPDTLLAGSSSPINNPNKSSNDGCCDRQSHHEHSHPRTTVKNSVAVPTFSPNPYMDFRRSMQEMVEARDLIDVKANWDCLHELLLCYLALNPKSTHKFIIAAFADLIVSLMAAEGGGKDNGNITGITDGSIPAGQCM